MEQFPLVSIITPCFNGEAFIDRYFQSVLSQTYPNIELIFVNDGSTDQTETIALSYSQKLAAKGFSFKYLSQDNQGQAAALNLGLKNFTGEFLTWPDSDDVMTPDCISLKANYLLEHPEYGLVFAKSQYVDSQDPSNVLYVCSRDDKNEHRVMEDLMTNKLNCACGSYMIRTSAFRKAIPTGQIYVSRAGQNWQMLLPVAYHYDCGFLDDLVYIIYSRQNSHSRSNQTYEKAKLQIHRLWDIQQNVIYSLKMPEDEDKYFSDLSERIFMKRLFSLAADHHRKDDLKALFHQYKEKNEVTPQIRKTYYAGMSRLYAFCSRCIRFLKRKLLR